LIRPAAIFQLRTDQYPHPPLMGLQAVEMFNKNDYADWQRSGFRVVDDFYPWYLPQKLKQYFLS
jgi:hypothetical protein